MSLEITMTASLAASKGGASISSGSKSKQVDMTGVDMAAFTQAVGTSAEALASPPDIGYPAHVLIINLDSTNFVRVYKEAAGTNLVADLYPGEFYYAPNAPVAPGVKADTAACQIEAWVAET